MDHKWEYSVKDIIFADDVCSILEGKFTVSLLVMYKCQLWKDFGLQIQKSKLYRKCIAPQFITHLYAARNKYKWIWWIIFELFLTSVLSCFRFFMFVSDVTFRCCQHWCKEKWPVKRKVKEGTVQSVITCLNALELKYVTMKVWRSVFLLQTEQYMPILCSPLPAPLSPSSSGRQSFCHLFSSMVIAVFMHNDLSSYLIKFKSNYSI